MKTPFIILSLLALSISCIPPEQKPPQSTIESWTTTGDRKSLLTKSATTITFSNDSITGPSIEVDSTQQFQSVDGFGFALTGGSAQLINGLDSVKQNALLEELFMRDSGGIGISYLRISIGASDLDDHAFTYNDVPRNKSGDLTKFDLGPDKKNLIPILKKILALNPNIKIMGSPWSPPAWMKENKDLRGGNMIRGFHKVYADYFVLYINAMASEGIPIDAITIQNEPENANNTPSMLMKADEQSYFIKMYLGPAFRKAGIKTKIVVFDHNADHPNYPISILNDPETKQFVDGTAFHLYAGEVTALSEVHNAHPDRNLYFTEQWTGSKSIFVEDLLWHTKNLIIGAPRNWSRTVLEWNLASDPSFNPHTPGGCTECMGALTIGDSITRNVSYYIIAHASKFVPPGSVRIFSTDNPDLPNVAYVTPEGKKVLIAVNEGKEAKHFDIKFNGKHGQVSMKGESVGSFVW